MVDDQFVEIRKEMALQLQRMAQMQVQIGPDRCRPLAVDRSVLQRTDRCVFQIEPVVRLRHELTGSGANLIDLLAASISAPRTGFSLVSLTSSYGFRSDGV